MAVRLCRLPAGLVATAAACIDAIPTSSPIIERFDVTSEVEVRSRFASLTANGITADLLFNNAGYQGDFANILDYEVADFRGCSTST